MSRLFPIYFALQSALPAVLALTYPASRNPFGPAGGIAGVLDSRNRATVLAPLAAAFVCAVANLAAVGPRTTRVMEERKAQGEFSVSCVACLVWWLWKWQEGMVEWGRKGRGVVMLTE